MFLNQIVCPGWLLLENTKPKEKSDSASRGKGMTKGKCPKARKEKNFLLWKRRLPERIPLIILEVDPFTKYFIKEGELLHMPLLILKEHTQQTYCFPQAV